MLAQIIILVFLIAVVFAASIGTASTGAVPQYSARPLVPAEIRQNFSAPRPILRKSGLRAAPKAVAFSEDVSLRAIDKRGRVTDKQVLINDVRRRKNVRGNERYPIATV